MWTVAALVIGFGIDLLVGDPHSIPHPVVLIGKLINLLERGLRCVCPKTPHGERVAGAVLWGRGHRVDSASGAATMTVRYGRPVAAPGGRKRDVLADIGRQVAAGREHESLFRAGER